MIRFKIGLAALLAFAAQCLAIPTPAHSGTFMGEKFYRTYYFVHGGLGDKSGHDASNARDIVDATFGSIEAGTLIEKVYMIVDTAITGTTDLDVGDDDTSNGFIDGSLSVTLGTPGMYGWNAKLAGSYLRTQTAGATDAADIYVVPNAKYYTAAKSLKLDVTTANTAGKFRVLVEGYKPRS